MRRTSIRASIRSKVFRQFDGRCFYCGVAVTLDRTNPISGRRATIDHFVPLCSGLETARRRKNFVLACLACNHAKGHRSPLVFLSRLHELRERFSRKFIESVED